MSRLMEPSLFDVPAAAIVHWRHNFGLKSRKREITKIGRVSSAKKAYSGDKVLCFPDKFDAPIPSLLVAHAVEATRSGDADGSSRAGVTGP